MITNGLDRAPVGGFFTLLGIVTVIVVPIGMSDNELIVMFWYVLLAMQVRLYANV